MQPVSYTHLGGSMEEKTKAIDANVQNLKEFTDYATSKGVTTGLWTQSQLTPSTSSTLEYQKLRDFDKEVKKGGITTLKTDVAWVGSGYSFGLDGISRAYDIVTETNNRPNIVTLEMCIRDRIQTEYSFFLCMTGFFVMTFL